VSGKYWRGSQPPSKRQRRRAEKRADALKTHAYFVTSPEGKSRMVGRPQGLGRILREKYYARQAIAAHKAHERERDAGHDEAADGPAPG
jgi:hypothetical protein